jgi:phosphatidate cytidylyltransferase
MEADYLKSSVFKKRTVITIIGVPAVIAIIWFGMPWLAMLAVIWGMMATYEFYSIVRRSKEVSPLTYFGMIWAALFILSPLYPNTLSVPVILTTAVVLPLLVLLWRKGKQNAFANWGWTVAGILYVGWILSYLVGLRNLVDGRGWVLLSMGSTFGSDICAYLFGRAMGRHKLAPYISPNKTWEGAVAGVVGSVVVAVVVASIYKLPIGTVEAVFLGIVISIAGQLGDLIKSLFKRNMTVKDSSNLIPGHGGFLDRMDSQSLAGVAVYYYVFYVVLAR